MKVWGQRYATAMGLVSILIWASVVSWVKLITEGLSPVLSVALIYSVSALFLLLSTEMPQWRAIPKMYLWGCGVLFVSYEILFLLAIALTTDREQVLLVTMINYLWPPLMILFSMMARQLIAQWYVLVGFVLVVFGLLFVIHPDFLNLAQLWAVLQQNPWSYSLAFIAALLWPAYCVLTKKYAQGHNAVVLFFAMSALGLWLIHGLIDEPTVLPDFNDILSMSIAGICIGFAYRNWNQSMQYGHLPVLMCMTYFMPVLSAYMSMLLLGLSPAWSFWAGAVLVSLGALICWLATAENKG